MKSLSRIIMSIVRFPAKLASEIREHNSCNITQGDKLDDGFDMGALEGDLRSFVLDLNRGL